MKKLYWRPSGLSRAELLLVALVAVMALVAVEHLKQTRRLPHFSEKLAAARLAQRSMNAIKAERLRKGDGIDREADPLETGMIGQPVTNITSNTGHLPAKLISTNPNFAAVLVAMLKKAGVQKGSVVAVGVSGSFPALNVATYAALQTLSTDPLVIVSVAASEWGATNPKYTWLDMERTLTSKGFIDFHASGGSRGGIDDRGFGISKAGRTMLDAAIERAGVRRLEPTDLEESIEQRMNLYYELAKDRPIAAYINVGGGSASVGTSVGKKLFKSGLNTSAPRGVTDSVMTRFVQEGVPVIHISGIKDIADRYGLSTDPTLNHLPGQGGIYARSEYNPWYVLVAIALICGTMVAFLRLDIWANLSGTKKASH